MLKTVILILSNTFMVLGILGMIYSWKPILTYKKGDAVEIKKKALKILLLSALAVFVSISLMYFLR